MDVEYIVGVYGKAEYIYSRTGEREVNGSLLCTDVAIQYTVWFMGVQYHQPSTVFRGAQGAHVRLHPCCSWATVR